MAYSTFIHSNIVNPAKPLINEVNDSTDTVTFDIPLLTRLLELTRENIKSDEDLHVLLTNLIKIKNRGVLTMNDYDDIAKHESIDEIEQIKKLSGL